MDPQLQHTLLAKFTPVAGGIVVVLAVARFRGLSWRDGLGLRWPPLRVASSWLLAWLAWAVLQEVLIARLGLEQPARWPEYSVAVFWLRVATIGVVGPAAEELFFRGLAFNRLGRTKLRVAGTVVVTAAVWSAMHPQSSRRRWC